MNKYISIAALAAVAFVAACTSSKGTSGTARAYGSASVPEIEVAASDSDENVAIDQIPAAVRAAALARLPGFVISKAERETENGILLYSLEGTVGGVQHELEVSPDGQKVSVEDADDDEDDDGDDGDED